MTKVAKISVSMFVLTSVMVLPSSVWAWGHGMTVVSMGTYQAAPMYATSAYAAPMMVAPTYAAPMMVAPTYAAPMMVAPTYQAAPMYNTQMMVAPTYQMAPVNTTPMYVPIQAPTYPVAPPYNGGNLGGNLGGTDSRNWTPIISSFGTGFGGVSLPRSNLLPQNSSPIKSDLPVKTPIQIKLYIHPSSVNGAGDILDSVPRATTYKPL